jgi:choline monooxygenase
MLSPSFLDQFDGDSAIAHGLPGDAYTSAEFLRLEQDSLFSRQWVFAGFAHDLRRAGDVRPLEVAGQPLFLLRDATGGVIAFHNLCRHRNLKLIDAADNCGKLIRCPYHSWSYDLCGALRNAPCFGGEQRELPAGFELDDYGLWPVACEVWHDWIFVNLAPEPASFDAFLAPLRRQLGSTDASAYVPVATLDFGEIGCNWKLLMENFIEPYHVQFVHRTTTRQPLEDHFTIVDEHCIGSAVELGPSEPEDANPLALEVTSRYLTLFPNFVMGSYQPDQLGVYLNEPLGAERTRQRRVIYRHRDAHYSDAQLCQLETLWREVHAEDHAMCERLQQGRHSPLATDGGVLSPRWEIGVRRFQEMVADAVRPALTDRRCP